MRTSLLPFFTGNNIDAGQQRMRQRGRGGSGENIGTGFLYQPFDHGFMRSDKRATDTGGVTHNDGLPTSFTSKSGTPFQFQSFTGNNALLLGPGGRFAKNRDKAANCS